MPVSFLFRGKDCAHADTLIQALRLEHLVDWPDADEA
jgi:hypothetical protein